MEILIPNSAIRNLIREDKVHQIYSMMQTGQDIHVFADFLIRPLHAVPYKAPDYARDSNAAKFNVNELRDLIDRGAGINNGNGSQARAARRPLPTPTVALLARK